MAMHDDEIDVREDVVRELVADQFPGWAGAPVRRVASDGTVNAIFRIGDEVAARFPLRRRAVDAARAVLEREAAASRRFAGHSPVPAPRPIAIGEPGEGYPLPWAVQSWLPGTTAPIEFEGSPAFAHDLAGLVSALRATGTGGRVFQGNGRGGDLRDHDEWVEECFVRSEGLLDVPHLRRLWDHFRELPRTSADVMSHGDLQPLNVLVADGRLTGVLDTGGFAPADPALDAMAAWYLLGDSSREIFREELNCDDLEWERSKAWSFQQCLGAIWYYIDSNPAMYRMGRLVLDRIRANTKV
ncbi:Predicted kinase, aminoglycoside phosphotransferase (APT) family [Lentzea xinjiangensis]|uniref:Predicted kinase, aminoglycoside phosphotransferase (APT) family n=1 Tax=Lentzea xinjiangensis TaxID=402600 RepID=A0A1H9B0Q4_9PSEU|nr:aminoglycoside phosphotransferase family protein [Lentzea xinjiangensis]SEP82612.1 Predicted kinase, aminoglycoside phosphotransferase (APT) family [Lentzea xinjiangensis]